MMKSSRFFSILIAICLFPLVGLAEEEAETIELTIHGPPGSVVMVDGEEMTIPDSGVLTTIAGTEAVISTTTAPVRVILSSGSVIHMGVRSSLTLLSSNSLEVTSGVALVFNGDSTDPAQVTASGDAIVRVTESRIGSAFQAVIEEIQDEVQDEQETPAEVPTPEPTPTPATGTPT